MRPKTVKPNVYLDVKSPFNSRLIKKVKMHKAADIERMLKKSKSLAADKDCWLQHSERVDILNRLAELVKKESNRFARLIALEGGKPLTDARIEVARAIDGIHLTARELMRVIHGEEIPMGFTPASHHRIAWTTKEPIGVVVAVSAFNHPLNLIIHQVVPAIAVGCPIIIKPAEATPLNALRFTELVQKAGLPAGWLQVCICETKLAQKLVTDSRVNFFSFIGSAKVGWMLRSKLAPGTRCALEHGGVAPVIIGVDADLETLVVPIIKGGFYHAGQVCVSAQAIYVPSNKAKALTHALGIAAAKLKVGNPLMTTTDVGPLISEIELNRVDAWVKEAVREGATLICGGKKLSQSTYAPTILLNPSLKSKVSTSEIFGPVICVYTYQDIQKAIELANRLEVAFHASVFTKNIDRALDVVTRLDATAVMVNDHTAFRVDWMPFAGRKHSGLGTGGIGHTMRDLLQDKMVVIKTR